MLGLPRDASLKDIKAAYRRLAREFHPDKNQEGDEDTTDIFLLIVEAYEALMDEELRHKYDNGEDVQAEIKRRAQANRNYQDMKFQYDPRDVKDETVPRSHLFYLTHCLSLHFVVAHLCIVNAPPGYMPVC